MHIGVFILLLLSGERQGLLYYMDGQPIRILNQLSLAWIALLIWMDHQIHENKNFPGNVKPIHVKTISSEMQEFRSPAEQTLHGDHSLGYPRFHR